MSAGRIRVRRSVSVMTLTTLVGMLAAGCSTSPAGPAADNGAQAGAEAAGDPAPASPRPTPVQVTTRVGPDRTSVPVDQAVQVTAQDGRLRSVRVTSPVGDLTGSLSSDGARWRAESRLEPATTYRVATVAERTDGNERRTTSTFTTAPLTLDEQTYPSVAPLAGETVGVGMPVIVTFDVPVTDRASIERHLRVTSTPQQRGAWHWLSDNEVHWRPAKYWQAGTDVTVDADINSVPAGNGVYGQESRTVSFHVGDSVISRVNAQTHQMQTFVNGSLARTTPITTGKPGFTTRSGVKVIIEKFRQKRMNSETVGIAADDPEAYDIDDVEYAMRVTYSGEFLHAAPWSVGSQGSANVSHGCTGMSTADAAWLYNITKRGDVVEYTGTDRPMTLDNGYGDWNASFPDYAAASALR
ncbi:MAG: Ig-like domain-containing protein [Nocardioides sp.]